MNTIHTKVGGQRRFRMGIAALVSALAVVGGTSVVAATPASANETVTNDISAQPAEGSMSDFSYANTVQMGRNIVATADFVMPQSPITFSWSDSTTGLSGTVPPVSSPSPGDEQATATITGIPASECGRTLKVEASGQFEVLSDIGQSIGFQQASGFVYYTEDCGPAVWTTSNSSGSVTGFAGDGFTPGGQVAVSGTGPSLLPSLHCVFTVHGPSCTAAPWGESVSATTQSNGLRCSAFPFRCVSYVVRAGGQISGTFPKPIPGCDTSPDNFTAVDLSTDVSASGVAGTAGCLR
jgi:hypothetical protein